MTIYNEIYSSLRVHECVHDRRLMCHSTWLEAMGKLYVFSFLL